MRATLRSVLGWPARRGRLLTAIAALIPAGLPLSGQSQSIHGKVVIDDGSRLPEPASIQRICPNQPPLIQVATNDAGEYSWSEPESQTAQTRCVWRAVLKGYVSTEIDYATLRKNDLEPDIVLRAGPDFVPRDARPAWERAAQAIKAEKWADAETGLRALVAEFPKIAAAWSSLGVALEHRQKADEARQAYERAIQTEPELIGTYHLLAALELKSGNRAAAVAAVAAGVRMNARGNAAAAYLDLAMDAYKMNLDGAEAAVRKAIEIDKGGELPQAEYVLGLILEAAQDSSAAMHFKWYRDPASKPLDEEVARALNAARAAGKGGARANALPPEAPGPLPGGAYEIAMPGGLQALAAMARLPHPVSSADFVLEFCRAVTREASVTRNYAVALAEEIHAYMDALAELSAQADPQTGRVSLSLAALSEAARSALLSQTARSGRTETVRALRLLGWVVADRDGADSVEPGNLPEDEPRQHVAAALGIDEVEMAKALSRGAPFEFEIRNQGAAFFRPRSWGSVLGARDSSGLLEALARNPQAAAAYAALCAAGPEASEILVARKGLVALANQYAETLRLYGEAFRTSGGRMASPGGPEADSVWAKLAGASPADPKAFLPALLDKDQGRLAAFYFALTRGDAAHQKFFTGSADAAARFYRWYKDSGETPSTYKAWRQDLFWDLPLDESGEVRFPGGRAAWTKSSAPAAESLLKMPALEGLVPVATLERKRGQSFDEDSARLLAEHHASWRALFPYFEKLPGLGSEEFRALASFAAAVSKRDAETQNRIVGEWHSLVELTELGVAAGSLDSAAAARAFRGACEGLSAPGYSAGALAALRAMAGGADDPDEAVASGLLRLTGERRAAFDRLRALQHAPLLASLTGAGDAQTLAALSGLVYAALLDPRDLLASEDPQFLAKHQFRTGTRVRGADLFLPSVLILASQSPGSYLEGGFANFKEQTKDLARALADNGDTPPAPVPRKNAPAVGKAAAADPVASTARSSESTAPPEAVFRANSSLVEVYATVMDGRDRYVDGLTPDDFLVLDGGQPVEVFGGGQSADLAAFESRAFPVSVALLLDATGSMRLSLPALKAAAFRLIHDLRPIDSAAVYCFNNAITELQPFTSDKEAAGRAVLKVRAEGNTALNDALVRITRDLAGRGGKRVIVVFTDGADNASGLTSDAVAQRARAVGVPIYTIAHGDALKDAALLKNLDAVARDTGALAFALRTPDEMAGVFAQVSKDIEHGYYFTFRPAPGGSRTWRPIEVRLRKNPSRKVRAREGYVVN